MRYFLSFFLAAILFTAPASATQRSLLSPLPAGATLSTTADAVAELGRLNRAATAKGRLRVIVGLRVPFAPEASLPANERLTQRRDIAAATGMLRGRFASAVYSRPSAVRSYTTLPFMALEVTPTELAKLAADPLVVSISENLKLRSNLAESGALIRAPEAWSAGYSGAGQTVAILDTGVDKNHPFLAGKVVSEACYSASYCPGGSTSSTTVDSGLPCPLTEVCAHGTHVAGIAAGRGEAASGIAKDANIIAIQVFSQDPDYPGEAIAWFSDVLAGLNRVFELRSNYSIAAVNLSLGGGRFKRTCDSAYPAMTAAIANLRAAGIATVIASGNGGFMDSMSFPGCISQAVSVGAVSDSDWGLCDDGSPSGVDKITCYSNSAPFLSLLAPGSAIMSSVPGGGYETWHGTSMSTPHVAGAWALMRQKYPSASVPEILAAFQASGRMVTDDRNPRSRRPITKPRIDVTAALNSIVTFTVETAGSGSGTVSIATPRGTATCSASCTLTLAKGTPVKLSARAARGSRFMGWTGVNCRSARCNVSLSEPQTLTATFTQR